MYNYDEEKIVTTNVKEIYRSIQNLKKPQILTEARKQKKINFQTDEKEDDFSFEENYQYKTTNLKSRKNIHNSNQIIKQLIQQISHELNEILEVIKDQKQVIAATIHTLNEKAEKYKSMYQQLVQQMLFKKKKEKEREVAIEQAKDVSKKFKKIFQQMNINLNLIEAKQQVIKPQNSETEYENVNMSQEEMIKIQKLMIKKLVQKLQDEREQESQRQDTPISILKEKYRF